MPNYPIPPWLHGANTAAQWAHGIGIGQQSAIASAHLAAEMQRLQHQSQLEQIRLQIAQEQEERQSRQKDQQLEVEKAYHEQLTALKQKELEEAQQRIDQQAKVAGQKYAAQQRIQQRIAAGEDPDRVYLEEGAMAGASMSGLSGFSRNAAMAQRPEGGLIDMPGGGSVLRQPSGTLTPWVRPGKATLPKLGEEDLFKARDLTRDIIDMGKNIAAILPPGSDPTDLKQEQRDKLIKFQEQMLGLKTQRHKLFQKASPAPGASPTLPTAPGAAPGPIPLPKTEKELLEGQVYQTTKGLGMWDASQKKFKLMPPQQSAPTQEPTPPEDPEHPPDEE